MVSKTGKENQLPIHSISILSSIYVVYVIISISISIFTSISISVSISISISIFTALSRSIHGYIHTLPFGWFKCWWLLIHPAQWQEPQVLCGICLRSSGTFAVLYELRLSYLNILDENSGTWGCTSCKWIYHHSWRGPISQLLVPDPYGFAVPLGGGLNQQGMPFMRCMRNRSWRLWPPWNLVMARRGFDHGNGTPRNGNVFLPTWDIYIYFFMNVWPVLNLNCIAIGLPHFHTKP
jgi:hypothetical protein